MAAFEDWANDWPNDAFDWDDGLAATVIFGAELSCGNGAVVGWINGWGVTSSGFVAPTTGVEGLTAAGCWTCCTAIVFSFFFSSFAIDKCSILFNIRLSFRWINTYRGRFSSQSRLQSSNHRDQDAPVAPFVSASLPKSHESVPAFSCPMVYVRLLLGRLLSSTSPNRASMIFCSWKISK